ncbi:DUF2871 domain-containing protein [Arthrobacter sp. MYb229]|uniref:DUF2871 domain-containing protein n=1 Tax=Micrococcaceae TaxID=1268 RepID=UPI000BB6B249|nr:MULTISPECIES: DUF2871 domain-containing protein [Micrococcaceae]PCC29262.1 hypothetical protein CIK76_07560 [Glutamicibacter sp. BW80]PRA06536.1 DUF2871 domain-containing protein [Arthrobacter sp. MYb229]PRB53438.1 DUF2871 domain-containing protein [Arthrobacter sp. MYb216]
MRKLINIAFAYMLVGVASGLFYREFTKINEFPEGGWTQLSVVHTHLLVLGFIVTLLVLLLEKAFNLSAHRKLYAWFLGIYNAGVILTAGMQVTHGMLTVLGLESSKMISGIAGLGHMALTAGMILLFVMLRRSVPAGAGAEPVEKITA